jgi:hypothetical protein
MRTRWNSQPLSESSIKFLRALRERGLKGISRCENTELTAARASLVQRQNWIIWSKVRRKLELPEVT